MVSPRCERKLNDWFVIQNAQSFVEIWPTGRIHHPNHEANNVRSAIKWGRTAFSIIFALVACTNAQSNNLDGPVQGRARNLWTRSRHVHHALLSTFWGLSWRSYQPANDQAFKDRANRLRTGAGSYWFVLVNAVHVTACVSETPFKFWIDAGSAIDFHLVK